MPRLRRIRRQKSLEDDLRAIRKNPGTRLIIAQEAELRRRIRRDPQLAEDFDFLVRKTGWRLHRLLQLLYWDSNMMHADPQTVLGGAKRDAWPIDRKTLKAILRDISALAEQVEQVNKTEFSPARSLILQNGAGLRILRKEEKYLLKTFGDLPGILRFYCGELKRKLKITDNFWPRQKERWKSIVDLTRRNSLYEGIRSATPDDKYHATRLLRLVNASREVQGLPPVEFRAFIVWLNRLRKRHSVQSAVSRTV